MQTISTELAATLAMRDGTNEPVQRRPVVLYELYDFDYYPDNGEPFDPTEAIALFSEVAIEWMGHTYNQRVLSRSSISRFLGPDFNRCDLTFANGDLYMSTFILQNEVEGMRLVIRYIDQGTEQSLDNSLVISVNNTESPSSVTETIAAIGSAQVLATINYEIPRRTFSPEDPQGRSPADPLYEGFQFMAQQVMFNYPTYVTKRVLGFFSKKKLKIETAQWSSEEGTSRDQVVPLVFGRVQLELLPFVWVDTGFFISGLFVAAGHKVTQITDVTIQTGGFITDDQTHKFTQTYVDAHKHLGDPGGTGTNASPETVDGTLYSNTALLSRTAYLGLKPFGPESPTASAPNGSEDAVPTITALVLGECPLPDEDGDFTLTGFSDNPAYIARFILTDPDLCGLDESVIDDEECIKTAAICDEILIDDTGAEILALMTDDATALTDGLFTRFNSSGIINTNAQLYELGTITDPPQSIPRLDALSIEPLTDDSCPPGQHLDLVTNTCVDDGPTGIIPPPTAFYRRRYTFNAPLTAKVKAVDFLLNTVLPSFRGYIVVGSNGRLKIKTERPADSTFLRDDAEIGATSVAVNDVEAWIASKQGLLLIDPGSVTSETREVTDATYSVIGDDITLVGFGTGITLTASGATLGGGSTTVPYSGTLTVSGTPNAGDVLTATIDGIVVAYTLNANDTIESAAAMLSAAINATWSLRQYIRATVEDEVVTVFSKLGNLTLASGLSNAHTALLSSPTAAPVTSAVGSGAMSAGVYDVAYSYKSPSGETFVSPSEQVTLTAGQRISVDAVSLPTGCVGLNWYLSKAPNDPTMALLLENIGSTFFINSVPEPDADPVPIGNGAGEETIRVMASFTQSNIRQDSAGEGKFTWPLTDRNSSINQILIKYREASAGFAERELYVNDKTHQQRISATNKEEIDGSGVDNYNQGSRLANSKLSKCREGNFYCGWTTDEAGLAFEEGDVICITDATGGFVNLPLRIEDIQILENLDVDFIGGLYSTIMYSDQTGRHPISIPSNLRYLNTAPPIPTGLALEEIAVTATSSTVRGSFEFGATPVPQVGRVFIKRDGDSDYSDTGIIVPPEAALVDGDPLTGSFEIAGLPPGTHDIKVRAESRGLSSALSSAEDITSTTDGTIDITNVITTTIETTEVIVGGDQVIGAREAAVPHVTASTGTAVSGTAAGIYDAATQTLINDLKTQVNALTTAAVDLKAAQNTTITRLEGHGLVEP